MQTAKNILGGALVAIVAIAIVARIPAARAVVLGG
jgi:hypothetical protein